MNDYIGVILVGVTLLFLFIGEKWLYGDTEIKETTKRVEVLEGLVDNVEGITSIGLAPKRYFELLRKEQELNELKIRLKSIDVED